MMRWGMLAAAVVAAPAFGQTVTYTFTGQGSGSLAGVGFSSSSFEITLQANLVDRTESTPGVHFLLSQSAVITIDGVVTDAAFVETLNVASNTNTDVLVLGRQPINLALFVMNDVGLDDYDLSAPFGPVTDFTPVATEQFIGIATSAGDLTMQSIEFVTFEATPTPGVAGLLAVGGLVASRRRR